MSSNSGKDQFTHEENLVYISETADCYDGDFRELAEEIKDGINGQRLTLQEHHHSTQRLHEDAVLIRNSLWIIHYSCLVERDSHQLLHFYLCSDTTIPKSTQILVCVDGDCSEMNICDDLDLDENSDRYDIQKELNKTYDDRIVAAVKYEALKERALGYLNTANPHCGPAGVNAIKGWKEAVENRIDT